MESSQKIRSVVLIAPHMLGHNSLYLRELPAQLKLLNVKTTCILLYENEPDMLAAKSQLNKEQLDQALSK